MQLIEEAIEEEKPLDALAFFTAGDRRKSEPRREI
jgi:hypothetical protein